MNPFISAFYLILYQPLFNSLILLYVYLPGHDLGVAIIVLTLLIKLILYPLGAQAIRSQKSMSAIQPKMKEIQEKYKHDKEQQSKALMEFYKKEKVNPFSGCLPLLAQLPILIGLFQVFLMGFGQEQLKYLYSFVPSPGSINVTFLGILNLAEASIVLAILTGIFQFIQTKMVTVKQKKSSKGTPDFSQMMQKQMLYFFPAFTIFILWRLPAAIALYWLATTLFTIVQQYIILKKNDTPRNPEN
ncbi:MAG: YidC/Oxa1 family membrane protein insertase [Candidatus Nealsonbacteria bacterium]|nr:YidC/Oxa1 family membrane protein insertase [Candidatus Nealsonbacteria bacterium]